MPEDVRRRGRLRAARLAGVPIAATLLVALQGLAAGSGAALAVVGGSRWLTHRTQSEQTVLAPPPVARRWKPSTSNRSPATPPTEALSAAPTATDTETASAPDGGLADYRASRSGDAAALTRVAAPTAGDAEADPLQREAELLEQARNALATRPLLALTLAEAHAIRFPQGALTVERELLIVDALGKLGRTHEAITRGRELLGRAGGSIYEDRIRTICDSLEARTR